jgi:hypothetical protein
MRHGRTGCGWLELVEGRARAPEFSIRGLPTVFVGRGRRGSAIVVSQRQLEAATPTRPRSAGSLDDAVGEPCSGAQL